MKPAVFIGYLKTILLSALAGFIIIASFSPDEVQHLFTAHKLKRDCPEVIDSLVFSIMDTNTKGV